MKIVKVTVPSVIVNGCGLNVGRPIRSFALGSRVENEG